MVATSPNDHSVSPSSYADVEEFRQQLTPRSKVKAMLAALEDDSEDNTTSRSVEASLVPLKKNVTQYQSNNDDSSDDDVVLPRGKLAARLQTGKLRNEGNKSKVGGQNDCNSAYERIRQQLLQHESSPVEDTTAEKYSASSPIAAPLKRRLFTKKRAVQVQPNAHSPVDSTLERDGSNGVPSGRPTPRSSPKAPSNREPSRTQSPSLFVTPSKPTIGPEVSNDSPGLFISPYKSARQSRTHSTPHHDSDLDTLSVVPRRNRFLELVARKHAERETKEAANTAGEESPSEKEVPAKYPKWKIAKRQVVALENSESSDDDLPSSRLTQPPKPRKASKKALEEIHRETQRMSRNLQLAHQVKTKKRITKDSLLARFGFSLLPTPPTTQLPASSSPSAPLFDVEYSESHQTPDTSPVKPTAIGKSKDAILIAADDTSARYADSDDDLPTLEEILAQSHEPLDKGKGKAIEVLPEPVRSPKFTQRQIKVVIPNRPAQLANDGSSGDELEIIPTAKVTSLSVFDRIKPLDEVAHTRPLRTLRALANLASPGKATIKSKSIMTGSEMQFSLQQKARQQAIKEREERLQDLRRRGIIVQTAEEKEHEQVEVENLLEKARMEAEEIKQREKRSRQRNGEEDTDDLEGSDGDDDYDGSDADQDEMSIELSGSDEEIEELETGRETFIEDTTTTADATEPPIDAESEANALESEAPEQEQPAIDTSDDDLTDIPLPRLHRSRATRILDDDDDELEAAPASSTTSKVIVPRLHGSDEAPMGLTQAFAISLGDNDSQVPGSAFMEHDFTAISMSPQATSASIYTGIPDQVIPNSQHERSSLEGERLPTDMGTTSFKGQYVPSLATQYSEIPDPSQDVGFEASSPIHDRFVSIPPSTIDTIPMHHKSTSPRIKKRGRLHRRERVINPFSDEEIAPSDGEEAISDDANAFSILTKASKATKKRDAFNKKKSNAKEMVEEQAAESEDEYAGLGGASGDDSNSEEDEEVRKMIDESEVNVNERELAAFYAGKERASDEKAVEKLYRDINNGTLRKKRGGDFDFSDSEDDEEARRRRKRRDFAKMRKALLANEKLEKIADDPKKLAFLRAIEDHDDEDDDLDFLDQLEDNEHDSQHVSISTLHQQQQQDESSHKRKRPLQEALPSMANRAPPAARRSLKAKRPSTLAEIRQSLSFLIDEPNAAMKGQHQHYQHEDDYADDGGHHDAAAAEDGYSADENHHTDDFSTNPNITTTTTTTDTNVIAQTNANLNISININEFRPPREPYTARRRPNPVIVDRLSLKRAASDSLASNLNHSNSNSSILSTSHLQHRAFAFQPVSITTTPACKPPSLLRRATMTRAAALMASNHAATATATAMATKSSATSARTSSSTSVTSALATKPASSTSAVIMAISGTERAAGGEDYSRAEFVRRTAGTKRSSVNFGVREMARAEGSRRRVGARREEGNRMLSVSLSSKRRGIGLGGLGGGRFE